MSFKDTFRAIYQWQVKHYKNTVNVQMETKTPLSNTVQKEILYKVLKWSHPNLTDLMIYKCDYLKSPIKCTDKHMQQLLHFIDDGISGTSLSEIKNLINVSLDPVDIEIALNADLMLEHLMKLVVIGPISTVISAKPKYKLVNVPDNLSIGMYNRQMKKLLNKIERTQLLKYGCKHEEVQSLLYFISSCIGGASLDEIDKHMKATSTHMFIIENVYSLVNYCIEHKLIFLAPI